VHLWIYVCIQRGSKCEHSQGAQTYVSLHGMGLCTSIYIYTCVCFKVCTGKAETYVISHNLSSYTKVSTIRYMYACGWMYIYKEILSVWVREGRDICEFAQHQFIYKSSDDIIHVYLWIYVCIQDHTRGSKCECVRGQEHTRYMKCCIEMLYIWVLTVVNFRASNSYE
jgi:hypothetical protein